MMEVTYIDHMGSDLSVVNAARVSFSKKSKGMITTDHVLGKQELRPEDKSLIQFLARGCTSGEWKKLLDDVQDASQLDGFTVSDVEAILKHVKNMPDHWTPFGHTAITLHIKAPIFVARQLGKHQVGLVWNEVSRRYVDDEPEFYVPEVWRKRADNIKQGSSDAPANYRAYHYRSYLEWAIGEYEHLLSIGVCPEQARMVLPQSMMTEWYWTGNLYAFANVFIQRTDSHAQREVQEVAEQIGKVIAPLFPVSWEALTG